VLVPLVSIVLRIRRGRRVSGEVDAVRKRLAVGREGGRGTLGRIWGEVVRGVVDTVRMGGGGLV
jgi:hypothetical protein